MLKSRPNSALPCNPALTGDSVLPGNAAMAGDSFLQPPGTAALAAPALAALRLLEASGHEAWVVGGAARDLLRGRQPKDWDIATSAAPEQMRAAFAGLRVLDIGLRHGTLTVIIQGCPIETSVYRRASDATAGGDGGATIADDLAARDFTLNAIAFHPERGFLDVAGGRADLAAGLIRAVGDPAARFQEDALRVLRALRFAAVFAYRLEPETAAAMRRLGPNLSRVAPERIYRELVLLLCGREAAEILRRWPDVVGVFLPEMLPMVGFNQYNPHHIFDVYEHTLRALEVTPPEPAPRLAIFFHDIGKPASFTRDAAGIGHFYGHAALSADIAFRVQKRMSAPRVLREKVCDLIHWHDATISCSRKAVRRWLARLGPEMFRLLLQIKRADNLAHHPNSVRTGEFDKLAQLADEILAKEPSLFAGGGSGRRGRRNRRSNGAHQRRQHVSQQRHHAGGPQDANADGGSAPGSL
ncbi:MAG: CCA tRNA nucleotidyltransferase [Gracilibacteraceae bacterium]|jgi:tRNA nucleotidyltransferase (CCA-adding enzyme)|nr:CCA tRNA nucleotidyltransferase [Gracilibacteraceae bacterium]